MEKVQSKQVQYIQQNLVQGTKDKFRQNLAPAPKLKHPSQPVMKSMRKVMGAMSPLSVLEDVKANRASRDSLDSLRENFPAIHEELGRQLHERIVQAQINGESVPADRVAMMSLVMGKAMNNTMTPRFVGAVQASFQVEEKQEPPSPVTPNPIAESMQTPLERTLV
jgi:molybdopterin converting factor small subunit